jgi:integrase
VSAFRRGGGWFSKFQLNGMQVWTPGGPWETKRQAQEAERRHRDYLQARRSEETCASFADRWLEEWPRPERATRRLYATAAKQFAAHFGPTKLGDVERLSARTWALTVPRYVSKIVRTMYADAMNVGLVETNPFENLRLPTAKRKAQVTSPTLEQIAELAKATTVLGGYGPEFGALIQFAAWSGLRTGELQALQWEDFEADLIRVRRARKRDGSHGMPKNGEERLVPFLPPARVLDEVPRRPDPFVFHSPRGKELDQGSMFYAWREVRATAGLRRIRFHDLRHFTATQLLDMGLSHFDVSVMLGHNDGGRLVMERYGHPSKDAARARLLGAFELDPTETSSFAGSTHRPAAHGEAE